MKRDMDLARSILLRVEECEECDGIRNLKDLRFDGYSPHTISYNVRLLHEAGLVVALDESNSRDGLVWTPRRLTWAGHEFLDASRHEGIWRKATKLVIEKTGGLSFDVLKSVLIKLGTEAMVG